jgi:hypothetical protein
MLWPQYRKGFNQPQIATPSNPVNGETYSYGFEVLSMNTDAYGNPLPLSTEPYDTTAVATSICA